MSVPWASDILDQIRAAATFDDLVTVEKSISEFEGAGCSHLLARRLRGALDRRLEEMT